MKKQPGLTLVELIAAMAILGIILISFLSLFTTALTNVYRSGDQVSALNQASGSVESKVASGTTDYTTTLTLSATDGSVTIEIDGGTASTQSTVNGMSSTMLAFVSNVSQISLSDEVRESDDLNFTMTITGENTNFDDTTTTVKITDSTGASDLYTFNETVVNVASTTELSVDLNLALTAGNDYIFVVETPLVSGVNEILKDFFSVITPAP